jgi:flagellin
VNALTASAVQINGKNAFAATVSGSSATVLAAAINSNVGQHRVTAAAFNTVKGAAPTATVFAAGAVKINNTDIGAASSVEELVSNINRDAAGVTAVLGGDGTIELSNDTGADILIAGTAEETAGFVAAVGTTTYKGFVTLTSMDGNDISVKAKSPANGYIGGVGTVANVKALGLNETADSQSFTGSAVSSTALTISDDLRINGVKIGASNDASATAKVAAINTVSAQTGVTASASTEVVVGLDVTATNFGVLNGASDGVTFSINGQKVNFSGITSLASAVTAINDAAVPDVRASADSSGRLILSSTTGANITERDATTKLVTSVASTSGDTTLVADIATGATVRGRISLTSSTGADIRVESAIAGSAAKIGMADQGGSDTLVGGALSVTTQAGAGRAITAIDSALDQVSMSRADLGAFQNRLTAAVDNLSSQSTNVAEAKGRIMDTDYAKATTELARTQIIQQAATAMLAQANQQPQMVLSLLQ